VFLRILAESILILALFKAKIMDASWTPFYVVIALFVLAIISPWVFPNKMVSNNKDDIRH
jgi:hypothetical protein